MRCLLLRAVGACSGALLAPRARLLRYFMIVVLKNTL